MPSAVPYVTVTPRPHQLGTIADLEVISIGHFPRRIAPGTDWGHHNHGVVFIAAGSGVYSSGAGAAQPVGPGCMWCLRPSMHERYAPLPDGWWEEFYIELAGPGLARWFQRGWLSSEQRVFRLAPIGPLLAAIAAIVRTMQEGTPAAADRSVLMTERLLLDMYLSRTATELVPGGSDDGAIAAAISHLHQHLDQDVDLVRLAKGLGLSHSSLRRGILAATGEPVARCLRRLRCETAKKLLSQTALPIGEIARQVGIPSAVVFTRIFKRYTGMVPSRYRMTPR